MAAPKAESRTVSTGHEVESSVRERYGAAARELEPQLCCPVSYDPRFLAVIPAEILERDYGCGDPTSFIREGETVLDLGSGGGKVCYIAAQIVGPAGRVIGVDCNKEMLALACRHQSTVSDRIGYNNVEFRYGRIQDLRLDLERLAMSLAEKPVADGDGWLALRDLEERLRREHPLVDDESVDCVVSNCVLNLVRHEDRHQLFAEVFRVLRRGGRIAVSDIVSDEEVPDHLRRNPELWTGCVSGAFREDEFLFALEDAGFHGIEIARRAKAPWRTVEGIEFRSITLIGRKGKQGPCLERNQAVIYRGPFKKVEDDDGHVFRRGERMAVCDKTYNLFQNEPYAGLFEPVNPRNEVPLFEAEPFDCRRSVRRHPRESKGGDYAITTATDGSSCCGPGEDCC